MKRFKGCLAVFRIFFFGVLFGCAITEAGFNKRLTKLLRGGPEEITDGDRIFTETVADIKVPWLFRRLDLLDAREASADEDEKIGILRERASIKTELSKLSASFKTSRRYRWQASGASRRSDGPRTEEE